MYLERGKTRGNKNKFANTNKKKTICVFVEGGEEGGRVEVRVRYNSCVVHSMCPLNAIKENISLKNVRKGVFVCMCVFNTYFFLAVVYVLRRIRR